MFFDPFRQRLRSTRPRMVLVLLICSLLSLLGGSLALSMAFHNIFQAHAAPVPPASVSKTWYFAEGRVGAGFKEYLTLSNPDPSEDCSATISYLPEGTVYTSHARKPLMVENVTVPHASRYTASANHDLHFDQTQNPGELFSAVVTVPSSSTCPGLVVERPMYFSFHGVSSGSDVVGATSPTTSSYFADIPVGTGVSTFLSILNPSSSTPAAITATYYAAGTMVGTQTLSVAAGARGTLAPTDPALHLPAHLSAIVTSEQSVVVERSVYRSNVAEGVVGMVSSASAVVGSPVLSNHWLFAEGYAAFKSQEYLVVSNLSATTTSATVTLEYQNTHHQTLTEPVPAYSQVVLDVNQLNAHPTGTCDVTPCATTPEVSSDVMATAASLVVERQMFFRYAHTVPNTHVNVTAMGGTDVVGASAPMTTTTNFAEGYTNLGYNEWLTLQNPTDSAETLVMTLRNEYGHTYTENVNAAAKSRVTVDVTQVVREHLVQSGEDFRAHQVSMSVVSSNQAPFVAERPMYFQLSTLSIQGGTDVVGFSGVVSSPSPSPTPTQPPSYSCTMLNTNLTAGDSIDHVTVGPDGNVWFAEAFSEVNKLGKITPAGVTTEYSTPTTNSAPEGITTGPDGNMWFTERLGNNIGKITTTGVVTEYPLSAANSQPSGITTGPDGNLWFTEAATGKIGKITTAGVITEYTIPTVGARAYDITLGPDGNLWFPEDNQGKIGKITTAGVITEYSINDTHTEDELYYITTGPDGNLWFGEFNNNAVARITPAGVVTTFTAGISAHGGPYDIATGPDNNLWFTEEDSTSKIGVMTSTGTVVTEINLDANATPGAIIQGADHNIWFSDYTSGKIGKCVVTYP